MTRKMTSEVAAKAYLDSLWYETRFDKHARAKFDELMDEAWNETMSTPGILPVANYIRDRWGGKTKAVPAQILTGADEYEEIMRLQEMMP